MELSILDTIIAIVILAIIPLGLLGVLANTVGADSRDMQDTSRAATPWI